MRFVIVLASLLVANSAAPERISRSLETTIEKYPSIVQVESLNIIGFWIQTCAGNILTSRLILSTVQCFDGLVTNSRIRAGATQRQIDGDIHYLERVLNHPNYNTISTAFEDYNIALVYLSTSLTYSDQIQPSTILAQDSEIPDGSLTSRVGWGTLWITGLRSILHEVDSYALSQDACQALYSDHPWNYFYDYQITNRMMCAGILDNSEQDACQSDSGSPVFYSDLLVGIVSWGAGCGGVWLPYPDVATKVSAFTDWIVANNV